MKVTIDREEISFVSRKSRLSSRSACIVCLYFHRTKYCKQ